MQRIILISLLAAGLFQTRAALADANLCNSTRNNLWATYGEYSAKADWWSGQINVSDWIAGWYYVQPGQCVAPIVGDVCNWWAYAWDNCPSAILYYAFDSSGGQWGDSGDNTASLSICTTYNAFFESAQTDGGCPADRQWLVWSQWWYNAPANDVTINFVN